jgi:hypothetical protein
MRLQGAEATPQAAAAAVFGQLLLLLMVQNVVRPHLLLLVEQRWCWLVRTPAWYKLQPASV